MTIASYNLENFSNNKASNESPDSKAQKLARAFAKDMQNPDIIGVTEVQDNNGQSAGDSKANESYERLIAEIEKAGGVKYKYVNIDPLTIKTAVHQMPISVSDSCTIRSVFR